MRTCTILALVSVAFLSTAAYAEQEFLIASWENTMNHWTDGGNYESTGFDTIDGVTNGSYSLMLDCKSGWSQGLLTTNYSTLNPEWQEFFPQLNNASKLRLDVTSSKGLMNITSGIQLFVFMQGGPDNTATGPDFWGFTTGYVLLNSVYGATTTTETIEFDLKVDVNGAPINGPHIYPIAGGNPGTGGGWFDMRIGYNISGGQNGGIMFFDNLRAVKIGTDRGDFNGNGEVGIEDYTTWADHFGLAKGTWLADGSYVGLPTDLISIADYTTWADNFGKDYDGPGVPEPATMSLLGLGALALLRRKH